MMSENAFSGLQSMHEILWSTSRDGAATGFGAGKLGRYRDQGRMSGYWQRASECRWVDPKPYFALWVVLEPNR